MTNPQKTKKIAVLGGGLSAMTAIYTLTQDPDWEQKYDITLYQMGWRVGGKGASGVNPEIGYRVEEHGLHLWMGFYENAFKLMETCYKELNRPLGAPLATFDDAFKGQPFMTFAEKVKNDWVDWKIKFPMLPGKPGDGILPGTEAFFKMWFDYLIKLLENWLSNHRPRKNLWERIVSFIRRLLGFRDHTKNPIEGLRGTLAKLFDGLEKTFENKLIHSGEKLLRFVEHIVYKFGELKQEEHQHAIKAIQSIRRWIWDEIGEFVEGDNLARRLWLAIDFGLSVTSGIIQDGVLQHKEGKLTLDFDRINDYDYSEWLEKHGADKSLTIPSPLVRSMYDGPFAFLRGDINTPNVEAGTILRIFFRLAFTCKENVVWRMQAGMGDTIFAPMYLNLIKNNKVKFKFFHKAKNFKLSDDGKRISKIRMAEQVKLENPDVYNPLIDVNGLPCWPSRPNYEYIDAQSREEVKKVNLESMWADWKDYKEFELEEGKDFDEVIIGFSLASIPHICSELLDANKQWREMLEHVQTVQTQAYQLWFNVGGHQLNISEDKLLSSYVEPVDTFAAMNQIIPREHWPEEHQPRFIAYLCGVLKDEPVIPPPSVHAFPKQEFEQVRANLLNYIHKHLEHLVPGAFDDNSGDFQWNMLVDIENREGKNRLNGQYWRANIDPSERYVLSVKASSKFRLETDGSGFSNLYLTGDWIQNGLNAGFVEGAVTSGLLTARAVSGNPNIPIIGENWCQ